MSADFKVGEYWIELFGLCGQLKDYDKLMKIKLQKVKENKLNLISLFLGDLFPNNHLEEKLTLLRK
jgi:small nuclear ribonucleoprotein (snRNP)-like protein